jgi:ATP-binding cassette subfamily C (CFTR/MRP) protein 1
MIDGVDLNTLSLQSIRSRLNAVPQDCCFVPGSIRLNLQPPGMEDLPEKELTDVLRKVKLWDLVEENGGLDAEFKASIFSHGQRQLFSLASSLLRPSKVIVLDEFTSR